MGHVFAEVPESDPVLDAVHADDVLEMGHVGAAGDDGDLKAVLLVVRDQLVEDIGDQVAALLDRIKATRPNFDYEIRDLFEVQPTMTDRDAPVVRTVAGAMEKVLSRAPDYVVSPGTYDQKHIDRIGKLKNCIAYGPGLLELAHKPDEYVGVEDMLDSAEVMARGLAAILLDQG